MGWNIHTLTHGICHSLNKIEPPLQIWRMKRSLWRLWPKSTFNDRHLKQTDGFWDVLGNYFAGKVNLTHGTASLVQPFEASDQHGGLTSDCFITNQKSFFFQPPNSKPFGSSWHLDPATRSHAKDHSTPMANVPVLDAILAAKASDLPCLPQHLWLEATHLRWSLCFSYTRGS